MREQPRESTPVGRWLDRESRRLEVPELAVIVPTYNERANILALAARLVAALEGITFEVIVVDDDSPDGTADLVRELARHDPRFRCLQRIGRRGLAAACVEGMLASAAPWLAVIDADLQHDETLLPQMLELLRRGEADVVVASRYLETTAVPGWDEGRRRASRLGTRLVHAVSGLDGVTDPLSGNFMLARAAFEGAVRGLSRIGFKLLLDILLSSPTPLRVRELPYAFGVRREGVSKLDSRVTAEFLLLLADKLVGRWVPIRFVMFAAVGAAGVLVHLLVLTAAMRGLGVGFVGAQAAATLAAITFNFAINNEFTYADRRLRGIAWLRGWASFALVCLVGAVANVGVAAALFANQTSWLLSALGGILVGAVWNYAVTGLYTWGPRRRA